MAGGEPGRMVSGAAGLAAAHRPSLVAVLLAHFGSYRDRIQGFELNRPGSSGGVSGETGEAQQ